MRHSSSVSETSCFDWLFSEVMAVFPAAGGRDLMFRSLHGVIRLKYAAVASYIKSFLLFKFA